MDDWSGRNVSVAFGCEQYRPNTVFILNTHAENIALCVLVASLNTTAVSDTGSEPLHKYYKTTEQVSAVVMLRASEDIGFESRLPYQLS